MLSSNATRGITRQLRHLDLLVGTTPGRTTLRRFATNSKSKAPKPTPEDATPDEESSSSASSKQQQPFLQNQEWVKFQQSIQVDGFQTGQVIKASVMKKSKGGKQARNRKARELALMEQDDNLASSDNRFPAIRYSPEETQELLKLAYDSLPVKTGKRGTRNQKRQDNRWKAVRQIRATYKQNIMAAHERRMEHRQWTRGQTKAVKEAAPSICTKDAAYQASILKRWAATMHPSSSEEAAIAVEGETVSA